MAIKMIDELEIYNGILNKLRLTDKEDFRL